jgi:hypothetical protein
MTPLERAIHICKTQAELARRVTGKPATGHVYYWLKNGFTEDVAIAIEQGLQALVAESHDAAIRAAAVGGIVRVEELRPDRDWDRDERGAITGYRVPVPPVAMEAQPDPRPMAAGQGTAAAESTDRPDMSQAA